MDSLRQAVIKLAHEKPEFRKHLIPILRKTAKSFEDAVKGKKFKNPETGNQVEFDSLPADEQKKIRQQWVKKNPRGSGGSDDPKESLKNDSDAYFAEHVSGNITKKNLTDALKGTGYKPRGKGSLNKKTKQVELLLDPEDGKGSPMRVVFMGSYMTKGDGEASIFVDDTHHSGQTHEDRFDMTGDPKKDGDRMMASLKDLVNDLKG